MLFLFLFLYNFIYNGIFLYTTSVAAVLTSLSFFTYHLKNKWKEIKDELRRGECIENF